MMSVTWDDDALYAAGYWLQWVLRVHLPGLLPVQQEVLGGRWCPVSEEVTSGSSLEPWSESQSPGWQELGGWFSCFQGLQAGPNLLRSLKFLMAFFLLSSGLQKLWVQKEISSSSESERGQWSMRGGGVRALMEVSQQRPGWHRRCPAAVGQQGGLGLDPDWPWFPASGSQGAIRRCWSTGEKEEPQETCPQGLWVMMGLPCAPGRIGGFLPGFWVEQVLQSIALWPRGGPLSPSPEVPLLVQEARRPGSGSSK